MSPSSAPHRRGVVALAAVLLVGCAGPAASPNASGSPTATATVTPSVALSPPAVTPSPSPTATPQGAGPDRISLELVASGLSDPIGIVSAGDGSGRLFVQERDGRVRVVQSDGTLRGAPFVDLSDRIGAGGERGLLGLAFHPEFDHNGRLFVHYSHVGDGAAIISELTVSADGSTADPTSERILLTIPDQFSNHNGGQLAFGPDGYLYIGLGDGGGGGDPLGSGQSRHTLLGKILRIDVDGAQAAGKEYGIPAGNPYAPGGSSPGTGLPEIWAYGLRNPWRFSFDRANGDLYIGDVGQGNWEEIDRQAAGSPGGENYGWNAYEGNHCYRECDGVTAVAPMLEYSHASGCSVTGGYVYRGTRQPVLGGVYLYGDYCSGIIWSLPSGGGTVVAKQVADSDVRISSFGEGDNGEIYLVDLGGGGLYRLVAGG